MLGLGSNISKTGKLGVHDLGIVTSNLVLKHNYDLSSVQPLSSGAADINADANGTDHIDVGVIETTTNDVTVSAWVYITDWIDYAAIFQNRHGSSPNQGFAIRTMSAKTFDLIIDKGSASKSSTSSAKNNNQWYHVCAVIDRDGNQYLYVDGVLEDSDDISDYSEDSLSHATTARIGKNYGTSEMNGYVCNVGYWNAALSQAQVKSIMNKNYAGLTASEKTDLVSWWNLDSVIPDTTTLVYDNHHGGGEILGSELVTGASSATTVSGSYTDVLTNYNGTTGQTLAVTFTLGGDYRLKLWSWSNYTVIDDSIEYNTGTHTAYIRITGNNFGGGDLRFNNLQTSTVGGSISNISVKLINGNTGTLS